MYVCMYICSPAYNACVVSYMHLPVFKQLKWMSMMILNYLHICMYRAILMNFAIHFANKKAQ